MASILLVDDDPDQREFFKMVLTEDRHEVVTVESGRMAIAQLKSREFDLVLLDVEMPRESGLEVLETIRREISSRLAVVMLSGNRSQDVIVRALDLGADDYIDKLTNPEVFLARVRRRLVASKLTAAVDGKIGPYRLLEKIGEGSSSEVYRALDTRLHRDVAIKVLKPGLSIGFRTVDRFRQEAQILASFRHPRVVEIFDFGDLPQPYIVLEYVEGVDLDVLLEQGLPPLVRAAEIIRSLLLTLHAIHGRDLVHRDIKPSNIRMGSDGHPHLLDFGLCKLLNREESLTPQGTILGTLLYSAPEQLNESEITPRTDLYACGALLYSLLVGESPFKGDFSQIISQVLMTPPKVPSLMREDGNDSLDEIVLKMMAKDPMDRYSNCVEAAEAIAEACELPVLVI